MQEQNQAGLTPASLRKMRQARRLSLKDFWGAIGYTMSRGHCYETGKTELPESARRLIHLEYVTGIPTDIDSERFKQFEVELQKARLQNGISEMKSTLESLSHE